MTKLLTTLVILSLALLSGCTSVGVIQSVAVQNSRNADALLQNLQIFFQGDESFFTDVMRAQLINDYKEIIRNIQANDNPKASGADLFKKCSQYYENESGILKKMIEGLTPESAEIEKSRYYRERPLTAEVAFSGMLSGLAASKWLAFNAIFNERISSEDRFALYIKQFRELSVLAKKEQAVNDLLKAYRDRKTIILQQSTNAKNIADQLVSAANTTYDADKFLKGITENNELLAGIGEYVLKSTNNPERKKAAEELLKTIKEGKK
jgi:hypothetical protein